VFVIATHAHGIEACYTWVW